MKAKIVRRLEKVRQTHADIVDHALVQLRFSFRPEEMNNRIRARPCDDLDATDCGDMTGGQGENTLNRSPTVWCPVQVLEITSGIYELRFHAYKRQSGQSRS